MSSDGAHLGISAERALKTILGGEPEPGEGEREDAVTVRARILAAAQRGGDPDGYGDCADMAAGMVLMYWQAHPEAIGPDPYSEVNVFTEGKLDALGITGFQWGWAVNAARFALSLPPEANPAIVEVGGP